MKNRFHVFVMTMLLSILMGVGTASHAALLTQTFNFGMADTDWSENLNIAQLNLSPGGILNSVTVTETVDWTAVLTGTNIDHSASVKITKNQSELQLYDSFTGPDVPVFDQAIGYSSRTGVTLTPGTGHDFGGYVATNSNAYNFTGLDTTRFLGVGSVPLQVSTLTENVQSTSGGGFFVSSQNTRADLRVQVVYNYSGTIAAVPEPSSILLLGLGGVACLIWRRKK